METFHAWGSSTNISIIFQVRDWSVLTIHNKNKSPKIASRWMDVCVLKKHCCVSHYVFNPNFNCFYQCNWNESFMSSLPAVYRILKAQSLTPARKSNDYPPSTIQPPTAWNLLRNITSVCRRLFLQHVKTQTHRKCNWPLSISLLHTVAVALPRMFAIVLLVVCTWQEMSKTTLCLTDDFSRSFSGSLDSIWEFWEEQMLVPLFSRLCTFRPTSGYFQTSHKDYDIVIGLCQYFDSGIWNGWDNPMS